MQYTLPRATPVGNLTSQSGVQQGDPLGPLLFSLVLNVVVKAIATHPECSDLYITCGTLMTVFLRAQVHMAVLDRKRSEAGVLLKRLDDVGQVDPQVALVLLRLCGGYCVHSSIAAWKQAQLSLSRGGLGLRSLSHHAPAAFIASLCFSGLGSNSHVHLLQSLETFNSSVHQSDNIQIGSVLEKLPSQKTLSNVLISNWALGKTAACDISVTSPLNSNIMSEAGVTAGAVAQATELRKHEANNVKCSEAMAAYGLVDGLLTSVQTFAMASATGQG
eukprot:Em0006g115a